MTDRTTSNAAIAGLTAAAHVIYLLAVLVVLLNTGGLIVYWVLGMPTVLHSAPAMVFRFVVFQIVLFGLVAWVADMVGQRLSRRIGKCKTCNQTSSRLPEAGERP